MGTSNHDIFATEKLCYTASRTELTHLVPETAQHILDVGCARGYLGKMLKSYRDVEVIGIEINAQMAREANMYLDKVFQANVESFMPPFPLGYFDCIIFADILEHLVDPWDVLRKYVGFLSPSGMTLLSIPNVQHYRVIGHLLLGEWEYQESGILDSTHLRFFTLKSIKGLLEFADLEPVHIERIYRARRIARWVNKLCFNRLEMFLAQQYVIQAKKKP